jgi:hypothetical protein
MYQNVIFPYLYEAQHVSGNTPPIIRSLKLHWQTLVFHKWEVVGCVVRRFFQAQRAWQRPPTTRPLRKTRVCQCSFRLLIMGGVSREVCWASYKYWIIKLWYIVASCWIFLYEFYYDSRIHEHQINVIPILPSHFLNIHFNIISIYVLVFQVVSFLQISSSKPCLIFLCPICATPIPHIVILDPVTSLTFYEQNIKQICPLCSFLDAPISSSS